MDAITQYLPFLIPLILLDLVLRIVAMVDLAYRQRTRAPKWFWVLVILLVSFGSVFYLLLGRED